MLLWRLMQTAEQPAKEIAAHRLLHSSKSCYNRYHDHLRLACANLGPKHHLHPSREGLLTQKDLRAKSQWIHGNFRTKENYRSKTKVLIYLLSVKHNVNRI